MQAYSLEVKILHTAIRTTIPMAQVGQCLEGAPPQSADCPYHGHHLSHVLGAS